MSKRTTIKLRNRKTGEVIDLNKGLIMDSMGGREIILQSTGTTYGKTYRYHSLADLNAEWEDYKPKEPYIKDESIRKAVKVWFDTNNFGCRVLQYYKDGYSRSHFVHAKGNTMKIFFREEIGNLKDGGFYDIDELCGEEDE